MAEMTAIKEKARVEVWIIEPLRTLFNAKKQNYKKQLERRCPHVKIKFLYGIGRINNFGVILKARILRSVKKGKVIFHCRGENAVFWAGVFKGKNDKVLLDARGYWPAELLYQRNITELTNLDKESNYQFEFAKEKLSRAIKLADGVSAVSDKLLDLLRKEHGLNQTSYIVPCCAQNLMIKKDRSFRDKWKVNDYEKLIIYSGTTAPYQHLEDLTLPFLKVLVNKRPDFKVVLITPEPEIMQQLVKPFNFPETSLVIDSLPQNQVAEALSAGDAGVLIRKPTLVNKVSQPVKVAEYLLAGLPIIFENGTGGIPNDLEEMGAGVSVNISGSYDKNYEKDIIRVITFFEVNSYVARVRARKVGEDNFLLENQINKHLSFYRNVLTT